MRGSTKTANRMFELIDNHTENGLIRTYYYANGNKLMQSVGKEDAVKPNSGRKTAAAPRQKRCKPNCVKASNV